MKCPLGGDPRYEFRTCRDKYCAWWSSDKEKCAILILAEKEAPKNIKVSVKEEWNGRDL